MSNRAWVTLATNDSYGLGALVLAHSLRRANTAHPAVVLVTPSVTEAMRNRLSAVFAEVITVNVLDSQDAAHLALLQRPELGITFTKIHCWTLTQYQKCVFLDADTLIVQNCDELFERDELSAAPDVGWPDCFNSGVFVFVPSEETYSRLITFAQERGSFDGGDQGLLNAFFADWAHGDINKHLPFLYNVTSAAFYSYIPALKHYGQDLKIIHFIGAAKPWLQQFNWESRSVDAPEHLRQFLQLWWDLFAGQVHSHLDTAMELAVEEEQGPLETPPESPPEDTEHHYVPEITADSEFPWHWPEASSQESEMQTHHINRAEIHDPWQHYRGNIPSKKDYSSQHSNFGEAQNEEEIRKYAWEYQESYAQNAWQQSKNQELNYNHHHDHHMHSHDPHTQHHHNAPQQHDHSPQHDNRQLQNETSHQEQIYRQQHHYQRSNHRWQDNFKQNNSGDQQSAVHETLHNHQNETPLPNSQFESKSDSYYQPQCNQFNDHSNNSHYDHRSYSHSDQSVQSHIHDSQKPVIELDHNQVHYDQDEGLHYSKSRTTFSDYSQNNSEINKHNDYNHFNPFMNQRNVEQIYHVYLDHCPPRRNRRRRRLDCDHLECSNGFPNGHTSDSESEEYIIPRHPYDGFYLRHTSTIDSRGRKICTHEIPPTPLPSPPVEEPFSRESSPTPPEEYDTASECEDQYTGVAGNLARVVPGSGSYQSEAIDELTRRQGWEAGNIDYMGADSFDNIWAKISQTLSQQPPKQPSPPRKEFTPPKEPSPPKEQPQLETAPKTVEVPLVAPKPAPETVMATLPASEPLAAPASEAKSVSTPVVASIPTPQPSASPTAVPAANIESPAPAPKPTEQPKVVSEAPKNEPTQKTEPTVPPTPPATPKSTPEASSPITESAPHVENLTALAETLKATEISPAKPASSAAVAKTPAVQEPSKSETTPEKPQDSSVNTTASTDSPPLANTPSKEEAPAISPSKSEERRKPMEKLQLSPPAVSDALPTPDSELEDAAALAHAIIASELSTSVTASTPAADVTPPPPIEEKRLSVEAPELPSPPVSLAQIGVKPKGKPTIAAQIESSVSEKVEPAGTAVAAPETPDSPESLDPATPTSPTTPSPPSAAGKKKPTKKVVKKEGSSSSDASTPVPPPRKKEKKPKEK